VGPCGAWFELGPFRGVISPWRNLLPRIVGRCVRVRRCRRSPCRCRGCWRGVAETSRSFDEWWGLPSLVDVLGITGVGGVRGLPGLERRETWGTSNSVAQANTRSFDSVNGLASESIRCAQDDRVRSGTEENNNGGGCSSILRAFSSPTLPHRTWKNGAPHCHI
jgi:hypothetical protein